MPKPKFQLELPPDISKIVEPTKAKAPQITITHANIRAQVETFPCSSEEIIIAIYPTVNERNG